MTAASGSSISGTSISGTILGDLSDRQAAVQQEARAFLQREWSTRRFRDLVDGPHGYSPELWQQLRDLGWPGIALPESFGGAGGTFAELAGLAEELGRALAPTPLIASAVAARAVELSGNEALKQAVLPGVASGAAQLTLAIRERDLHVDPATAHLAARHHGDGYQLDGVKLFVPYAETAVGLVTTARLIDARDAPAVFLVDARTDGLKRRRLKPLDWSALSEVVYDGVRVAHDRVLVEGQGRVGARHASPLPEVLLREAVATCAELLGVAKAALELAVDYANTRVAFGRPIGAFQAVKHKLVNLRVDVEIAAALVQAAVHAIAADSPDRRIAGARAAYWCATTLRKVPEGALQIFGGIGFTWEHDIHLFLRRAATLTALLGEPARYRDVVVDQLEQDAGRRVAGSE